MINNKQLTNPKGTERVAPRGFALVGTLRIETSVVMDTLTKVVILSFIKSVW